jgi:broad specificity phosphatase PhoE
MDIETELSEIALKFVGSEKITEAETARFRELLEGDYREWLFKEQDGESLEAHLERLKEHLKKVYGIDYDELTEKMRD